MTSKKLHIMQNYSGPEYVNNDVHLQHRAYTYKANSRLVAAWDITMTFTIDRAASEVWSYFKDFNRWQNGYGYYYPAVVGELYSREDGALGDETFQITIRRPNEADMVWPYVYRVLKVIPERLLITYQPIPEDGSNGGVSPGSAVCILDEHNGKTTVTIVMEHRHPVCDLYAYYGAENLPETDDKTLDILRREWMSVRQFWGEIFIPALKKLVYEGK